MGSKNISNKQVDIDSLLNELNELFDTSNYKVQRKSGQSGGFVLNANKSNKARDWLGLSLALTVRITPGPEVTRVWIGNEKWVDKIIVGCIGLFFSFLLGGINVYGVGVLDVAPLLLIKILSLLLIILPALGAYWQYKITQDVWNAIGDREALRPTANF